MTETRAMAEVVPFGKHRGKPVEYLLSEPDYLQWLQNNVADYVQQRYPEFYPVLMNSGRTASDSPAHNRLQALFLDPTYRRAFCQVARPGWEESVWDTFVVEASYHAKGAQA